MCQSAVHFFHFGITADIFWNYGERRKDHRVELPVVLLDHVNEMEIQPPRAELPSSLMTIRALEVRTPVLALWRDVPAAASLVGDKRSNFERFSHTGYKFGIGLDRGEAIVDRERAALQRRQKVGDGRLLRGGKYELGVVRVGHFQSWIAWSGEITCTEGLVI